MARPKVHRGTCSTSGCERAEAHAGLCRTCYGQAWRRKRGVTVRVDADPSKWGAEDLAWVAGLLEARGVFSASEGKGGWRYSVKLNHVDAGVVRRLRQLLGVGTVGGPYRTYRSRHGSVWQWAVSRKQHVQVLCRVLYPRMSALRREQIDKLLAAIERQ